MAEDQPNHIIMVVHNNLKLDTWRADGFLILLLNDGEATWQACGMDSLRWERRLKLILNDALNKLDVPMEDRDLKLKRVWQALGLTIEPW